MTIRELLETKARKNGDRPFLLFKNEKVSYAEMDRRANSVANGLLDAGIAKGDKVSVIVANCPEFMYIWFGLCKIGAIMVPINYNNKGEGLRYIIDHSDSKVVFVQDRFLGNLNEVLGLVPKVERIVVVSRGGQGHRPMGSLDFDRFFMEKSTALSADIPVLDKDVMAINYTSGTTGAPKGAMIPQGMYPIVGEGFASWIGANPDYVIYTCLPLYHANAQGLSTSGALAADCSFALGEGFSASSFWEDMRRYGATEFNYVGGMIPILFKQPPRADDRDQPVKVCWGAAAPRDIWREFEKRFGLTIVEGYGTTEDSIPLTNPLNAIKVGSIGKEVDFAQVSVVDPEDKELGPNDIGEIVIRPRLPYSTMLGYYKMPEVTLERARNLWWHTGDLGSRDEEGYFYFVDRAKDCIRRRGENISSFELEKAVNSHPAVLETAAIGVPSDIGEEDVKICVVLKPGQSVKPEELIAYCEDRVAYFMIPRYVEFFDSFPKTPTERIRKFLLKKEWLTVGTWDREQSGYKLKR